MLKQKKRTALKEEAMLLVDKLSFQYNHTRIFSDLSFQVEPGQMLYLKGHNGSGKTTLLKLIAGILPCDSEAVQLLSKHTSLAAQIFIVTAESNGLFLKLSAEENLGISLDLTNNKEATKPILDEWLSSNEFVQRLIPVEAFSTGMKKKLALARAFSSQCCMLLLDEPYSGLDSNGIAILNKHLKNYLSLGGMVVMTTHQQDFIEGFSYQALPLSE